MVLGKSQKILSSDRGARVRSPLLDPRGYPVPLSSVIRSGAQTHSERMLSVTRSVSR